MTKQELQQLETIAYGDRPWEARVSLQKYLKTVQVTETAPTRTSAQNAAMHLWFQQIADICQNQGVTMNLIISHTHDVMVTKDAVKGLWKALQEALYGTTSTTQLKKTGQIDTMVMHFVSLFAKEQVELPPFPVDEGKQLEKLEGAKTGQTTARPEYPEYNGAPSV